MIGLREGEGQQEFLADEPEYRNRRGHCRRLVDRTGSGDLGSHHGRSVAVSAQRVRHYFYVIHTLIQSQNVARRFGLNGTFTGS
ncbi:hypothetical protein GCM10027089_07690 [Nocardia thraciensis]